MDNSLYGDLLDNTSAGGIRSPPGQSGGRQPQRDERGREERGVAKFEEAVRQDQHSQTSRSNGKRRREPETTPDGGFHCVVCAEFVQCGTRAEHERGTLHRFNMFAEQPHHDRTTQVATEPAVVQARNDAAAAAALARSEAAQLAAQRQSVGYRMLKLAGWKEGEGLGLHGDGATAPIPTRLVRGRPGIERHLAAPARVTHKPCSVKVASTRADKPKAPGTRGERRMARNLEVSTAKKEEVQLRDVLNLGDVCSEGNSGPLWRGSHT